MRVLVTIASDGTNDAIGARIGSVLGARGHQVDVRTPSEVINRMSITPPDLGGCRYCGC